MLYLTTMKNLIIIGDYCSDSLVNQELKSSLLGHLTEPLSSSISFVDSSPNTIHTAFLLKQILITESRLGDPNNLVIFVNTDPRIQTNKGVEKAQGADFVVAKMGNGAYICGPNAGYSFSLIQKEIEYLYLYPNLDKGTQFRSRELYMPVCARLMEGKQDEMALEEIRQTIIPSLSGFYLGHIDNYGNMKTTINKSYLKGRHEYGDLIKITLNGITKEAYYVNNMFAKEPETLVIAPGSSGMPDDPYLELIVWQHLPMQSARKFFPTAKAGDEIVLK